MRARFAERDVALVKKLDECKTSLQSLKQMMIDFEPMYRAAPDLMTKLQTDIARVESDLERHTDARR